MQKFDFIKLIGWGMLFTLQKDSPYCVFSFAEVVGVLTSSPPHQLFKIYPVFKAWLKYNFFFFLEVVPDYSSLVLKPLHCSAPKVEEAYT